MRVCTANTTAKIYTNCIQLLAIRLLARSSSWLQYIEAGTLCNYNLPPARSFAFQRQRHNKTGNTPTWVVPISVTHLQSVIMVNPIKNQAVCFQTWTLERRSQDHRYLIQTWISVLVLSQDQSATRAACSNSSAALQMTDEMQCANVFVWYTVQILSNIHMIHMYKIILSYAWSV